MLVYVAYPLAGPRRPPLHRIRGDARAPTEPGARFPTLRRSAVSRAAGRQGAPPRRVGAVPRAPPPARCGISSLGGAWGAVS